MAKRTVPPGPRPRPEVLGLLRAIKDDPDDDAARLILADWLEEHGDPRGEFLRLEVELPGRLAVDPSRPELEYRRRQLLRTHQAEWLGPLAEKGVEWAVRRGMLRLKMLGTKFTSRHWAELGETEHFTRVDLIHPVSFSREQLKRLPHCPLLGKISGLDLVGAGGGWGHASLFAVLDSPYLPYLRSLRLRHGLDAEIVARLTNAPGLEGLRHLDLRGYGHDCVLALLSSPFLARLNGIHLAGNRLDDTAFGVLLKSASPGRLRSLSVEDSGLELDSARALFDWPGMEGIVALKLDGNRLPATAVEGLAFSDRAGNLRRLSLVGNGLGDHGAAALAASPYLIRLTSLDLRANSLGPDGVTRLAESSRLERLAELDLSVNVLGEGVSGLANTPLLGRLSVLSLAGAELTDEGLRRLIESPQCRQLTTLRLGNNRITAAGVAALAASPHLTQLLELDLHHNDLGDEGCKALAASPHLRRLQTLNLNSTRVTDEGTKALASWPGLSSIGMLDLRGNLWVREAGARSLLDSPHTASLRQLGVTGYYGLGIDPVRQELERRFELVSREPEDWPDFV